MQYSDLRKLPFNVELQQTVIFCWNILNGRGGGFKYGREYWHRVHLHPPTLTAVESFHGLHNYENVKF